MKKFVRFVVVLLAIVIAAIVVLGLIEPKDITVVRTAMIKAPKQVVFEQMVNFKNWTNWSPWYLMDSGKMKMTYYGTDGQPGSGYTWDGTGKTGAGDMRDSAVNGTQMTYKLTFTKPDKGSAWGDLTATDSAGLTKASWTCNMHFPFPMNAMLLFMNMDKMLGGDFESGLSNMKTYVESHATATASDIEITEVEYPAHTFEGMRKVISTANMDDMVNFFKESYTTLGKALGDKITGPGSSVYFTWDTVKKETDMAAVFPVSDTTKALKDASFIHIPGGKAVMAVLKGGYSKEMEAHAAIMKYMAGKGLAHGNVIEEYTVGSYSEPDSSKWVTNIYYLVK